MPRRSSVSYEKACGELASRLRDRFLEIEAAVRLRIREKAPIGQNADPEYTQGLREAIRSAIKYTLSSIEAGEAKPVPIPLVLLGQVRLAARHRVALETVLFRYTLGAHQISDLIVAEAKQDPRLLDDHLQRLLREQALVLERVLLELAHEYAREPTDRPRSLEARQAELVKRRLAGEPVDMSDLHYDFDRHHIGVVSQGCDSAELLHDLAKTVDGQLLCIWPGGDMTWAWIGTRHLLATFRPPTKPSSAPTDFLLQGLVPDGVRQAVVKIGNHHRLVVDVKNNVFSVERDKPIHVMRLLLGN